MDWRDPSGDFEDFVSFEKAKMGDTRIILEVKSLKK